MQAVEEKDGVEVCGELEPRELVDMRQTCIQILCN